MANEAGDECGLGLSAADAKPRLKWTRQLRQRFVDAVSQLWSHLQKYRLAENRDDKANDKIEDTMATEYRPTVNVIPCIDKSRTQTQFQNSRTKLQLQMEVQRKLQEQFEVQKHLQLRIEAQEMYLQSAVRKAQVALTSYSLNSVVDMEAANAEFSELASAVGTAECPSSPFLPPATCVSKQFTSADCSTDSSCLTCSERAELRNVKRDNNSLETSDCSNGWSAESNELIFTEGKSVTSKHQMRLI